MKLVIKDEDVFLKAETQEEKGDFFRFVANGGEPLFKDLPDEFFTPGRLTSVVTRAVQESETRGSTRKRKRKTLKFTGTATERAIDALAVGESVTVKWGDVISQTKTTNPRKFQINLIHFKNRTGKRFHTRKLQENKFLVTRTS